MSCFAISPKNEGIEMTAGKYVKINRLNLYYEIHGTGQPLVLLHGGLGDVSMFGELLPAFAKTRRVIGIELEGHGHNALLDRPLSFEQMADDVAALIHTLRLGQVDVMGYSLGGGVALQAAVRHPQAVRKLVAVSAPCMSTGWYPEVLAGMRSMNAEIAKSWVGSPMQQAYDGIAPHPDDWPDLVTGVGALVGQDYDWSAQMAAIKAPTLIVIGDADAVRTAHAVQFFELLGGGQQEAGMDRSGMSPSRLAILPGTTHYDILSSPWLAGAVNAFLEAPMPSGGGQ
jgi:pimeloyl-ACP methyl ester carboxylesterase